MKLRYDLHLHSCLSPCGDMDMTPNNLVGMAKLLGYDIIALTDHNSCRNTPAAVEVGQRLGITVVPGMELCTREEAHVVCLFPTVEAALNFGRWVEEHSPKIPNRPEIFGEQAVLDAEDQPIGKVEQLLIAAADIGVYEVLPLARSYGGTAFPAHVDKDSYSITASLGSIPPEIGFPTVELSPRADREKMLTLYPELAGMRLLQDSDAHYLENMPDPGPMLELEENTPACLIALLDSPKSEGESGL